DHGRTGATAHLRIGAEEDAMTEHGLRLRLHIVRQDVAAATDRRMRLRRAVERERRARTSAELDAVGLTRRAHQVGDVSAHRVTDADRAYLVPQRRERVRS